MLHRGVFLVVPLPPPEGDDAPPMRLRFDFRALPDCQRHQPKLTTASHEVCFPFDVFDEEQPLAPGFPRLASYVLGVSHPLDVLLRSWSIRPCFVPNPP